MNITVGATLITAFLRPSPGSPFKNSWDQYLAWASIGLKVNSPLVIFVESDLVPTVERLRPSHLHKITEIISISRSELHSTQYQFWHDQWKIDPERIKHSIDAYIAWNEKATFLAETANRNPFGSKHFFWIDFGYWRNEPKYTLTLQRPHAAEVLQKISGDGVCILQIQPLPLSHFLFPFRDLPVDAPLQTSFAAGYFGGTAQGCVAFRNEYYKTFEEMVAAGRFAAKEQDVIRVMALRRPNLFQIVRPIAHLHEAYDIWFEMGRYLAGEVKHDLTDPISAALDATATPELLRQAAHHCIFRPSMAVRILRQADKRSRRTPP